MFYRIEYSPAAITHLRMLTARQQFTVLDTVDQQLQYQPVLEMQNRNMRKIELAPQKRVKATPNDAETQRSVALMVEGRPVAALLPQAKELANMAQFTHLIEDEETVTLTLNSQPIAVLNLLVPLVVFEENNVDLESLALSTNPQFFTTNRTIAPAA